MLESTHPFSWASIKISLASTITLFLWFHSSVTIATHIHFQAILALLRQHARSKLWKWMVIDSCLTLANPTHLSHWSKTFWATLHMTNKCCPVSSHSWHNGQDKSNNCKPLLAKLCLVGSLSSNSLQAQIIVDGTILRDQSTL